MFTTCWRVLTAVGNKTTSSAKQTKNQQSFVWIPNLALFLICLVPFSRQSKYRAQHNLQKTRPQFKLWQQVEVFPCSIKPVLLLDVRKQLLRERCSLKNTAENSVLLCPWSRPTFPRVASQFVSTSVWGCCFQQSAFYIWRSGRSSHGAAVASRRYCIMRDRSQARFPLSARWLPLLLVFMFSLHPLVSELIFLSDFLFFGFVLFNTISAFGRFGASTYFVLSPLGSSWFRTLNTSKRLTTKSCMSLSLTSQGLFICL